MIRHRIAQGLMTIAVAALVVLGAGLVYGRITHVQFLSVQTGSMVPVLKKGDLVLVTHIPYNQLAVGDVITFRNPNNPRSTLTHRIVALPSAATNFRIVTKGDANAVPDTPIVPGAVMGRVRHHVPHAGIIVDSVRKPLGLLILIYVPALAIIIDEFRRLVAYYKKQVYRVPWRRPQSAGLHTGAVVAGTHAVAIVVIVGWVLAAPAQAALQDAVVQGPSSITTKSTRPLRHIMFRRIFFRCSVDRHGHITRRPYVVLYNPGGRGAGDGWYIQSRHGRLATFKPHTSFDARSDYDLSDDIGNIDYNGDFLELYDNHGQLVDSLSWGLDNSYEHPSRADSRRGDNLRRAPWFDNADDAVDWAVASQRPVHLWRE
jgi:signal peptidase I